MPSRIEWVAGHGSSQREYDEVANLSSEPGALQGTGCAGGTPAIAPLSPDQSKRHRIVQLDLSQFRSRDAGT